MTLGSRRRGRSAVRQQGRGDDGAVAVIVAMAMVALLGAAALAVDVGLMLNAHSQLQNGADAAALAIAQDCAVGTATGACASPTPTAQTLGDANSPAGPVTVASVAVGSSSVTVTLERTVPTLFAAALGITSKTVSAAATASWGTPGTGPAVLPLAFASCSFTARPVGTAEDLLAHQIGDSSGSACISSTSGQALPGGFGWLNESAGCSITVGAGQTIAASSNTGTSASQACAALLPTLLNTTVLMPVYDATTGTGTSGSYHISGWAEFQLLGWRFPSAGSENASGDATLTLQSPDSGLIGRFLGFTSLDKRYSVNSPNPPYATLVALTQ